MPAISKSNRKKAAKPYDTAQRASSSTSARPTSTLLYPTLTGSAEVTGVDAEKKSSKRKKKKEKLDLSKEQTDGAIAELEHIQVDEDGMSGIKEDTQTGQTGSQLERSEVKSQEGGLTRSQRKKLEKKLKKRASQPGEGLLHLNQPESLPSMQHDPKLADTIVDPTASLADTASARIGSDTSSARPSMSGAISNPSEATDAGPHGEAGKTKKEKGKASRKLEAMQAIIQRQVEEQTQEVESRLRREMEKDLQAMKDKIAELESEVENKQKAVEKSQSEAGQRLSEVAVKDEVIQQHEKVKEQLIEAVGCQVCFDTLRDPHILSCGHVACRSCLQSWFRTPGAYVHEVPDPLPEHMNLEFFTKVCHVCRTYIVSRPSRMYHLQSILEPLGIESHIPSASQSAFEADIWKGMFPPEKDQYRIHDTSDHVDRCPQCFGEIDEGECSGCGAEFSVADESVADFNTEDGAENLIGVDDIAHADEDEVNDSDDSENDLDSLAASDAGDWIEDDVADLARPTRGGAFREAMVAAREGRRDRHRARQNSPPSASNSPPRLPRGLGNFLDVMAEESDDDDITDEDEEDEEIGERGDYPSGPDESDSEAAMAKGDSESEGYEDSFIDDESVHDDVDGDVLMDSPEQAPVVKKGRKQRSPSVDSVASEPSIDELRRKRIQAMEQRLGPAATETPDDQQEVSRPTRASRTRSRVIVVSDDE